MLQYGKRIIFNKITGKVLDNCFGEMSGDLQEGLRPIEIDFIDLAYGDKIIQDASEYHIDVATKTIVIDSMATHTLTYDELQQQLLQAQGVI